MTMEKFETFNEVVTPEASDAVIEAYKRGVDRTLLRENLKCSPRERLQNLQSHYAFFPEVRTAGHRLRRESD